MTITSIILFVLIGAAVGYALCAGQAQARGLRECETCLAKSLPAQDAECVEDRSARADEPIPPRVTRAIRDAAEAIPAREDLTNGPRVFVDLDAISRIESGDDDAAVGAAGERGRYQMTEGAWIDTMAWLQRHRRYRVTWPFRDRVHDSGCARVVAGTYVNEVLPRWLACERLDKHDSTGPVPDCLLSRVAAYNCGAKRVRQAYARWQADAGTAKHWIGYLPASTQDYLARYAVASGFAAAKK
jgi:hypothetical protein